MVYAVYTAGSYHNKAKHMTRLFHVALHVFDMNLPIPSKEHLVTVVHK